MLSHVKILKAIENGDIEIFVSFYYKDGKLTPYENEQKLLFSQLKDNLYSDRLKLTMGPIVKVLKNKPVNSKYRFKTSRNCHDLMKSNNRYIINPGESIIILTNERIKLNGKYACIVVPRISLSDVGIVVSTAYVDPYYNGVMRLHLSNLSDKSYELTSLEAIAQCFFFELSDVVSESFKDQFSTKSVFFGQTWKEILNSDRNPFPIKKESADVNNLSNIRYQWDIVWSFIKKNSLIVTIITYFFIFFSGCIIFWQDYTKYKKTMDEIREFLEPTASEIIINSGETYGEKEIMVNYAKSEIISVLLSNDDIHYKILSGDVENETRIVFWTSLSSAIVDKYEINFTYVIVRRIK